eukprot:g34136.t1
MGATVVTAVAGGPAPGLWQLTTRQLVCLGRTPVVGGIAEVAGAAPEWDFGGVWPDNVIKNLILILVLILNGTAPREVVAII